MAVHILAAGGTQFEFDIGTAFICGPSLPEAEAQALLDDDGYTSLDPNHDGIACNG